MLAWIFTVEGSALLPAVPPGGGRNPGKRAAEVKKGWWIIRELHHQCGTRLWTACTRLISKQIKRHLFY
jgi:hypothetical protein